MSLVQSTLTLSFLPLLPHPLALSFFLSSAHLTPSFDTLFVFKPTPQAIYTRINCNDPVPLTFLSLEIIFFVYGIFSTQVNMHTLLPRDPKREVDSEISRVSRRHSLSSFPFTIYRRPLRCSPLNSDPIDENRDRGYFLTLTTRTRGPFSVSERHADRRRRSVTRRISTRERNTPALHRRNYLVIIL